MAVDLRHFRYFVAVAEELHFHRAAERLHVAQPALSLTVKRLEQELGVELLRRTTRRVELTAAGELFLARARTAIAAFDDATRLGGDLRDGERGRVVVGGSTQVRQRLSDILSAFRRSHPLVEVIKREDGTAHLLVELLEHELDVAIGVVPARRSEISYATIAQDRLVVAVPDDHPLAKKASVAMSELAGEVLLVPSDERAKGYNQMLVGRCRTAGFDPELLELPTHHDEAFQSVREGAGVEVKCADFVELRRVPGVTCLPFEPEEIVSVELFWRTAESSAAVHRFVELARRAHAAGPGVAYHA